MTDISEVERLFIEILGRSSFLNLEKIAFEMAYKESKRIKLDVSFQEFASETRNSFLNDIYDDFRTGAISVERLKSRFSRSSYLEKIDEILDDAYDL